MGASLVAKANAIRRELSEKEIHTPFPAPLFNIKASVSLYSWPFPHAVLDNALTPEGIENIRNHFEKLLERKEEQFAHVGVYDVFGHRVHFGENRFLDFLYDHAYKEALESLFKINLTRHTTIALHNNIPREKPKHIHTDYVTVPYLNDLPQNRLTDPSDPKWYTHHFDPARSTIPPEGTRPERRSLTAILYLSADWKPGMGGGTGIFTQSKEGFISAGEIEPVYNRILFTENTSTSFHNYNPSTLPNRNTLIQWFHTAVT